MTNTGAKIANLLTKNRPAAPDMTHALKVLGKGSMKAGLEKMGDYFKEEAAKSLVKGRIQGIAIGAGGAFTAVFLYKKVRDYWKDRKEKDETHEKEGEEILAALENTMTEETQGEDDLSAES